ncbi:MAG: hypothetical protein JW727_05520 [Candidatus Aenigmarchaeota archaeon]|nr:hypothetical protein [Candidatus Aenigmarchaeota archaeon]
MELTIYSLKSQPWSVLVPDYAAGTAENLLQAAEKDLNSLRGETCLGSLPCLGTGEISNGLTAIGNHKLSPADYKIVYDRTFLLICEDFCSRYKGREEMEMRRFSESLREQIDELPKCTL